MPERMTPQEMASVRRIAGLVLVNAMVFQEMLAQENAQVRTLQNTLGEATVIAAFGDHWRYITEEINYFPIFNVARHILEALPAENDGAVRNLAGTAQAIVAQRAALRHDLMGRVYHRLLADAKYLATFYTTIPAATLLLKVALRHDRWSVDWSSVEAVGALRCADLACGTGTLLMAAADAVADNHIQAAGGALEARALHHALMESVIYGFDVLVSAIHLSASTLAQRAPEVPLRGMNLYCLPLGGPQKRLGSIEFLRDSVITVARELFGEQDEIGQVAGHGNVTLTKITLPSLDLCVMNPPFTRSVGGNLLFGSSPPAERRQMQTKLARLLRERRIQASSTAGLGSVFVAAADKHLKAGGRMALVLPKTLVSGPAWQKSRDLLGASYDIEIIFANHEPGRWNFSESTDLSEVMLVARKRHRTGGGQPSKATVVNFWRTPRSTFEALAIAQDLEHDAAPALVGNTGVGEINLGTVKVGEVFTVDQTEFATGGNWMLPVAFAQTELVRAARHILKSEIVVPGTTEFRDVPLVRLDAIATLGPDRRDVYDGFDRSNGPTAYPALWGNSGHMTSLVAEPNKHLNPLAAAKAGRPLRDAATLWGRASRLLVAEKIRMNTQGVIALRVSERVLSNVWWSVALRDDVPADWEKVLALWFNSSLGILTLLARRQETEGVWLGFKKPTLAATLVPDPCRLDGAALRGLVAAYDRVEQKSLQPFPRLEEDLTRSEIDSAICEALGIPDLAPLRRMMSREPVISNLPLAPP